MCFQLEGKPIRSIGAFFLCAIDKTCGRQLCLHIYDNIILSVALAVSVGHVIYISSDNSNNNDCISRAPFHVKPVQLR